MTRGWVTRIAFISACVAVGTLVGCGRDVSWVRQNLDMGGGTVSIELPGELSNRREHGSGPGVSRVHRYDVKAQDIQYTVKGTVLTSNIMKEVEKAELSDFYESLARTIKGIDGKTVRSGPMTVAGRRGHELIVELQGGKLGVNSRYFLDGSTVYSFEVIGPRDKIKSESVTRRFFESVALE